jgi:hypothetical protein
VRTLNLIVYTHMYKLKLIYPTYKQHAPSQEYKELITYAQSIDLYTVYGIDCYQSSASVLEFTSARDRTFAMLVLAQENRFSVQCID